MLGLISSSTRRRGRLPYARKSPRRTPDHIHRHRGIQIHGMVTPHRDCTGLSIFIARSIRHRVGQSISSCIIYIHGASKS